ncbi:hypothetical protein HanXRQr2_Chr06g0267621 [Helianthus annuus]|uniref:Uncharacterized protein n=1 Tax=Helianthus annuus TaxID=4232 RepID=A0A9K3NJQ7_HELAN|nr:hypothetical protein HanXRQr2_Chr06g0267621 [Helianthus annuus]KAJ0916136.1 hypothetical protein HanPSC8_Chr06g0258141 [Helianthus annuus]
MFVNGCPTLLPACASNFETVTILLQQLQWIPSFVIHPFCNTRVFLGCMYSTCSLKRTTPESTNHESRVRFPVYGTNPSPFSTLLSYARTNKLHLPIFLLLLEYVLIPFSGVLCPCLVNLS